jgi:hypothetical protein
MQRICVEVYTLEQINGRIEHYTILLKNTHGNKKLEASESINQKLLSFWENYKLKHYKNDQSDRENKQV